MGKNFIVSSQFSLLFYTFFVSLCCCVLRSKICLWKCYRIFECTFCVNVWTKVTYIPGTYVHVERVRWPDVTHFYQENLLFKFCKTFQHKRTKVTNQSTDWRKKFRYQVTAHHHPYTRTVQSDRNPAKVQSFVVPVFATRCHYSFLLESPVYIHT